MMTLEERERRAYITGCPTAPALAEALDPQCDKINELDWEVERLEADRRAFESEIEELNDTVYRLEGELADAEKRALC